MIQVIALHRRLTDFWTRFFCGRASHGNAEFSAGDRTRPRQGKPRSRLTNVPPSCHATRLTSRSFALASSLATLVFTALLRCYVTPGYCPAIQLFLGACAFPHEEDAWRLTDFWTGISCGRASHGDANDERGALPMRVLCLCACVLVRSGRVRGT